MFIDPNLNDSITLDGKEYTFTETPNAPGIIYAEIGRKAKVYRVISERNYYALKTFKVRYRTAETVENTRQIAIFRDVPGLTVARRQILMPDKYPGLIKSHPEFTYAVLMPWVEGKSWFNFVTGKVALSRQESLHLARALANAMRELEQRDLAHCDLSSSNFIFSPDFEHVELIDIEDMFGHDLIMPAEKPAGTGGYAPDWIKKDGIWEAGADRFSTGILLSEILAWQFDDIRTESAGDAFFAEGEAGHKSRRFRMMSDRLEQVHPELSRLFKTAWYAESVEECPRIADWKNVLDSIRMPELRVAPEFLEFGVLDLNKKPVIQPQVTIKVKNTGGGVLSGQIQPYVPWLRVTPTGFSCSEGAESEHVVTLGANAPVRRGEKSYTYDNGINIRSNARDQPLSGSYTSLMPRVRIPAWVFVLGLLLTLTCVVLGISAIGGGVFDINSQNTSYDSIGNYPTPIAVENTQVAASGASLVTPTKKPISTATTQSYQLARVTDNVEFAAMRQSPGYSNKGEYPGDIVCEVPAGDTIQIIRGPSQADGLNWWYASWNECYGWMADHRSNGDSLLEFLP